MDIFDFAHRYLDPFKIKGDEIVPDLCPFCHGGEHRDKYSFALNKDNGTYNCKRGSCGKQGTFWQLCKDFGETADRDETGNTYKPKAMYKKPETKIEKPTDAAEKYLAMRKISRATMDAYGVGCDIKGNIVFPYTENGELVFVKFRPSHKIEKGEPKAWRETDTKPVLFGMDLCDPQYPLCIYEGEVDAMSGHEAGIPNSVSVPSGAEDLTWLDTCWDWLKQFKAIYLYGDNDGPGRIMIQKLIPRLADYRIFIVQHDCKDANELLYRSGPAAVKAAYDTTKEISVYGLIDLADVTPIDIRHIQRSLSGIQELDRMTGGFLMSDLSIWTGRRGEGKSTILGQLMLEAVDQGEKVCAYSGELRADRFQHWIDLQAAGRDHVTKYHDDILDKDLCYVDHEITERIKAWYREKFWLYDNTIAQADEAKSILKIFEYAVKRYNCRVFMIDNLMTCRYSTESDNNFYRMQSNLVGLFIEFAKRYEVHVHLVAHPRKTSGVLENDDVSGSGDITNRADNVFSLERLNEKDRAAHGCDVALKVLKSRAEGITGQVGLNYDKISRRLYLPSKGNTKVFGWERPSNKQDFIEITGEGD